MTTTLPQRRADAVMHMRAFQWRRSASEIVKNIRMHPPRF
eukprot:SAG11_NODE_29041_length_315_cov_0.717593_1_plen_39_part_01